MQQNESIFDRNFVKAAEGSGILIIIPVGNLSGILLKNAYLKNSNVIFFYGWNSSKNIEADDSGFCSFLQATLLNQKTEIVANLS